MAATHGRVDQLDLFRLRDLKEVRLGIALDIVRHMRLESGGRAIEQP